MPSKNFFLRDTFTENFDNVLLQYHDQEIPGGTGVTMHWERHWNSNENVLVCYESDVAAIDSGTGSSGNDAYANYYNTAEPNNSTLYFIESTLEWLTIPEPVNEAGISFRNRSHEDTRYFFGWKKAADRWEFRKIVSGSLDIMGHTHAAGITTGVNYDLKVRVNNYNFKCYLDGDLLFDISDSSTGISGSDYCGLFVKVEQGTPEGCTAGPHFKDFEGYSLGIA